MKIYTSELMMRGLDGSMIILKDVEGYYMIGYNVVVVQFKDGSEKYYTNFKVLNKWIVKTSRNSFIQALK